MWRDNLSFLLKKIEDTEKNELAKIAEIAPALTGLRIDPAIHVKLSKTAEKTVAPANPGTSKAIGAAKPAASKVKPEMSLTKMSRRDSDADDDMLASDSAVKKAKF